MQMTSAISSSILSLLSFRANWYILVWMSQEMSHAPSLPSPRKQQQHKQPLVCHLLSSIQSRKKRCDLWYILFLCLCRLSTLCPDTSTVHPYAPVTIRLVQAAVVSCLSVSPYPLWVTSLLLTSHSKFSKVLCSHLSWWTPSSNFSWLLCKEKVL